MVRTIQKHLRDLGRYDGAIDGERGPRTNAAVVAALSARSDDLPDGWTEWSARRLAVAFLQLSCHDEGIDAGTIDGWVGPQTRYAYATLAASREADGLPRHWRDETPPDLNPHGWPAQAGVSDFFGAHGTPQGRTPPLTHVTCPWTLKIAWNRNRTASTISIHEKCAASLERVLGRVHDHYGGAEIERLRLNLYGGSYNPRKMRGSRRWSMHAWGIAIDWDPEHNRLRWNRHRAAMARPDYDAWWRFWEEEGWLSLGRTRNFDWMHVQAVKL